MKFYSTDEKLKPYKKHENDAGFDLMAAEDTMVDFWHTEVIKTGVSCEIPKGYVGIIKERSSLGKKGVVISGVIDSDYRGEICLIYHNTSNQTHRIKKYDRMAQIIIMPCVTAAQFFEGKAPKNTERAENGFGSTDKT